MAKQKKNINNGALLYGKILKEFTRINNELPDDRKLSIADRRKYVSNELYPQFKGINPKRVGKKAISESVFNVLETIVPKEGCNINYISPADYNDIAYFELDEFITSILPPCINIKIDAGNFGETKIFNTLNYNYKRSRLSNIVDKIRKEAKNKSTAFFTGYKSLKPNKANDGTPENYYIHFVLEVNDKPIKEIEPVIYELPKGEKRKATTVRHAILERVKDLNLKKKRRVKARKNAVKNISNVRKKNRQLSKAKSVDYQSRLTLERIKEFTTAKKQLQTAFNRGNMTKEQFDKFNGELDRLIEQLKQGGII